MDTVKQQLSPYGHSVNWYPQVSITTGDMNSVSLERAEACTDRAIAKDLPGIMVWWSVAEEDTMIQYLTYLGR